MKVKLRGGLRLRSLDPAVEAFYDYIPHPNPPPMGEGMKAEGG